MIPTRAQLIELSNDAIWKLLPSDRLSDVWGLETEWAIRNACVDGNFLRDDVEPWDMREKLIAKGQL